MIEKPSCDGSFRRVINVAIAVDGPFQFLRVLALDQVGPLNGKTRLRNALLKKCDQFALLITIPYFEWDELRNLDEQETYLNIKLLSNVLSSS